MERDMKDDGEAHFQRLEANIARITIVEEKLDSLESKILALTGEMRIPKESLEDGEPKKTNHEQIES